MPPSLRRKRSSKKHCRNYKAIPSDVANVLAAIDHQVDSKFPVLRCVCCDKRLTAVGGSEVPWYQPEDGVVCDTIGNYGSAVFDSLSGVESLRFFVCDECLLEKARHAFVFQVGKKDVLSLEEYLLAEKEDCL